MSPLLEEEGSGDSRLACVTILYLETLHPDARGFKRGFMGDKYGYLTPAQFDVAIRIDVSPHFLFYSVASLCLSRSVFAFCSLSFALCLCRHLFLVVVVACIMYICMWVWVGSLKISESIPHRR